MNLSRSERLELAYRRVWEALHRGDEADLAQHERDVLHHAAAGPALGELAGHLALPASTASVLVKDLARRGFLAKARDPGDERRVRITLTPKGHGRIRSGSVLDVRRLATALDRLPERQRAGLVRALEALADAAE